MKNLFTRKQYELLQRHSSPENQGKDFNPVVKLTLPGSHRVCLLTEISSDQPNMAFGLCDFGIGAPKLCYIELNELLSLKNEWGDGVERDVRFKGIFPLSIYAQAARDYKEIIDNEDILIHYIIKNTCITEPD